MPEQESELDESDRSEAVEMNARRWLTRQRAVAGAGAVLLIGSIGAATFLYLQLAAKENILDAQDSARQAACAYAPTMANYRFDALDGYFEGVLDGATGDWHKEFEGTSKELREVLSQGQVTSKANDVQCGIKSADENAAEVIVVIGQTISSVGTKGEPQAGQLSMVMSLERNDGRWMVNKVAAPLLPASP